MTSETVAQDREIRRVAAILLFLSGAGSLAFQVLWIKQLTLVVGVEVHAVTIVVSAFFAGLALGSYIWERIAESTKRPLRLYAGIEIGAAIAACVATWSFPHLASVFARVETVSPLFAWALPLAIVMAPAVLMGGTLPVLVRTLRNADTTDAGWLYAANTAGAVCGALLPTFVLVPFLGVQGSAWATASLGAGTGCTAFYMDLRWSSSRYVLPSASMTQPFVRGTMAAILVYGVAGGLALGYEIVWAQGIAPLVSTRAFAVSIVLATYLAGLAIGSALFAHAASRAKDPWGTFGVLLAAAGLSALVCYLGLGRWVVTAQSLAEATILGVTGSGLASICARFAIAATVMMGIPTLLLGAAFPVAVRLATAGARSSRVGATLAANTLGGIVGATITGFVLVPTFGLLHALGVLSAAATVLGLAAALWGNSARPFKTALAVTGAVSIGLTAFAASDRLATLFIGDGSPIFYKEGRGATVAVIERGAGTHQFRRLYIQGVSNSGDAMPSLRYMRLQALLPLIIHNGDPRSALVIGYGTGITAGALLRFPGLDKRVVAELLPAVIEAGPLFKGSFDASRDGRLDIRFKDGRRELQRSDETYDLITLEPPPPSAAGVVNLYSRDFYRLASTRLNAKGIVAQWLPLATQNEDDTRSLVRSFIDVFPHATLWTTELHEMLLVGSPEPMTIDFDRASARFAAPDVAAALREVGVASVEALLATFVMDRQGLERFAADARPVTDDDPRIEYAAWVKRDAIGSVLPDLLNARGDIAATGWDPAAVQNLAARREELLTFYHAGFNALTGNRRGWAADMRAVFETDGANPYYRWFGAPEDAR